MSNDPWKHRSTGMKCATCMWFVRKATPNTVSGPDGGAGFLAVGAGGNALPDGRGALGRCRRRQRPTMNGYPAVFASDWCGDHKLDEAKI